MPAFLYVRMEDFMRSTDKKKDNKVLMSLRISAEDKEQIEEHLNSGGSYFSVYSDVKEAVKELLDLKFKILPALEDVACGKKHRRMGYTEEKIKSIRYKMSLQ
mgnify:FL=1